MDKHCRFGSTCISKSLSLPGKFRDLMEWAMPLQSDPALALEQRIHTDNCKEKEDNEERGCDEYKIR